MNVRDLKRFLEDVDDDVEVRFASQPNWPFEYSIDDVQVVDLNGEDGEEEPNEVVYLTEGSQIGYLPGVVSRAIGWS